MVCVHRSRLDVASYFDAPCDALIVVGVQCASLNVGSNFHGFSPCLSVAMPIALLIRAEIRFRIDHGWKKFFAGRVAVVGFRGSSRIP